MDNNIVIGVLAGLVVVTFFKERIAAFIERFRLKLKFRGNQVDYHAAKITAAIERLSSEVMLQRGDLQTIAARLDSLDVIMKAATGEEAARQANLYMEGLGALSRSANTSLEKQDRIEQLLIQVVTSLKKVVD